MENINILAIMGGRQALALYQFDAIINSLAGGPYDDFDSEWQGHATLWGCHNCQKAALITLIEERDDEIDQGVRCKMFEAGVDHSRIANCNGYMAESDPPEIPIEYHIRRYIESHGFDIIEGAHDQYTRSISDFVDIYEYARQAKMSREAKIIEAETGYVDEILAYYSEMINPDTLLNTTNFYSCNCINCYHYTEPGSPPCSYANDPIETKQKPRAPKFKILATKTGQMIPRCEMFRWREENCPEIKKIDLMLNADINLAPLPRHLLIDWFIAQLPKTFCAQSTMSGPLTWLPYERAWGKSHDKRKLLKYLGDIGDLDTGKMWALLVQGLSEANCSNTFGTSRMLYDPLEQKMIEFIDVNFDIFLAGERPFGLPQDWPVPWVKDDNGDNENE